MRPSGILLPGVLTACLALAAGAVLLANTGGTAPEKQKKGARRESAEKARPGSNKPRAATRTATGTVPPPDSSDSGYGVDAKSTITEHRSANGEIVYSVSASHFDISAPLRDLAAGAVAGGTAEEKEAETRSRLPSWRILHSNLPDPVVQKQIPPGDVAPSRGFTLQAPTTGFNFLGVGAGATPSDSNASVGNNQLVETVNVRYQVWSLNRLTSSATSLLGPVNINTLWSGFTGPCATQNSGDPIVLYDKIANRWLISQFTSAASAGFFYQCVAVSTGADATGTYARWAFAVPGGNFGDYPHFGVWTDAYYMMAHGFSPTTGGFVAGVFAAMDRAQMLAGNPAATWQVILDPNEAGHMPADLDGFAPPPTSAPGIFLSIHGTSMYIYRMKVDFITPGNTVKTRQATVPVAPATSACALSGSVCIPQPGTVRLLDSLGDVLMFRAAYRNFVDHESIVISHSVDPGVSGLASGVRWYDFRISGTPDAVCASYPCTYQQGTIADVANGRSRWMPSIAMDGAENILVGYSTTGKTNGSENHSIRYTGRAKGDPLGVMTAPEVTIVTGTANNTNNSRWGDYTSMSSDPFDDCTFWYVGQYYTVLNSWSTRIASAIWPEGSGAGECQAASCASRPASAPVIGSATVLGPNQINLTWSGIAPQPGAYAIERAVGACGSEGLYQPLAAVAGTASSYVDTTVQGGLIYSYRVIAATDAAGKCQALVASNCTSVTATGTCRLTPGFGGATSATSNNNASCGVNVHWTPATSSCPLTPTMRYSIFRGTVPDFAPTPANRIATCVPGPASFLDSANLASGVTYYYVVRAEDNSTGNGGECGGGNEESNSIVVSGTAYGAGILPTPGTWMDAGGDGTAFLLLNVAGAGDTADQAWRFVKTADDAGANHTSGGAYAYRNAGPAAANVYSSNVCSELQTPPLTVGATSANLQFWERHQIEYHWDGVAVEYSLNGGAWTDVPAPSNSPGAGCAGTDTTTGWETLSCTGNPPVNSCGYAAGKNAYNGPLDSGTSCNNWVTSATVPAYAHRCHPITGLTAGDTIQFRWRFTSDPGAEFGGFYLDDIAITNVLLPSACTPDICPGQPNGTGCNDGNACTTGEVCGSGVCGGGTPAPPAAINDSVSLVDGGSGTTISWSDPPGLYSVYRGTRSAGSPWAYNQTCRDSHIAASSATDAENPSIGAMFFYLVTRVDTCGESIPGQDSGGQPIPNPAPCP
jgi:hypothetical protein